VYKFTHLPRHLALKLPSNRNAVIIGFLAAAAGFAVESGRSADAGSALGFAAAVGVGAFLAWAAARELDPDHPRSAEVAAVLAGAAAPAAGRPALLAVVTALLTARILARTVGLPPTPLDLVLLIGLGFAAAGTTAGWIAGLMLAFAVARDHRLPDPAPRPALAAAFVIAAAATVGGVAAGVPADWDTPGRIIGVIAVIGLVAGLSLRAHLPTSVGDLTGEPLDPRRIQSGRRVTLGLATAAALAGGSSAITALTPVWAGVIGVALVNRIPRSRAGAGG
jgi:hypothetical protein